MRLKTILKLVCVQKAFNFIRYKRVTQLITIVNFFETRPAESMSHALKAIKHAETQLQKWLLTATLVDQKSEGELRKSNKGSYVIANSSETRLYVESI